MGDYLTEYRKQIIGVGESYLILMASCLEAVSLVP